jgi:hypothetical protein
MTDAIAQPLLTEGTVFIDTPLSVAGADQTMDDIRDIGAPDEVNFEDCGDLARSSDILSHLAVDLELAGLAGELRSAKIIYLAVTSRLFPWPLLQAARRVRVVPLAGGEGRHYVGGKQAQRAHALLAR